MRNIYLSTSFLLLVLSAQAQTNGTTGRLASDTNKRWLRVTEMPHPVGGYEAWYISIEKNEVYPKIAQKNGISGQVAVLFTVEKDGSLTDIHISRSLSPETDEEALRLIKSSPKWNPGKLENGEPCRTKFAVPIDFPVKLFHHNTYR